MIDFSTYRNHYFKIGDRLWGTLPTGTKGIIIDSYTRFRKDYKQGTGHKPFPLKEGDRVKGGGMYQGGSADMSAAPAMNTRLPRRKNSQGNNKIVGGYRHAGKVYANNIRKTKYT